MAAKVLGPDAPATVSVPRIEGSSIFRLDAPNVVTPLGLAVLTSMALSALLVAATKHGG